MIIHAAKIGISGEAVSKLENGQCLPDVYNLKLLARVYRVSIDDLLDFEDEKSEKVTDCIFPVCDIALSVNFWLDESARAMGFARETTSIEQPQDIDVYKMPESLYIRAYTDKYTAQLL